QEGHRNLSNRLVPRLVCPGRAAHQNGIAARPRSSAWRVGARSATISGPRSDDMGEAGAQGLTQFLECDLFDLPDAVRAQSADALEIRLATVEIGLEGGGRIVMRVGLIPTGGMRGRAGPAPPVVDQQAQPIALPEDPGLDRVQAAQGELQQKALLVA